MIGWNKSYDVSGIFDPRADYINFGTPRQEAEPLGFIGKARMAAINARLARDFVLTDEPEETEKVAINYRPKTWLIATTNLERKGGDTALSCALNNACIKKMQKEGHDPWEVIAPILRKEAERNAKPAYLSQIERISNSLIFTKPITDLMAIAKENQWMWCDVGQYWMRYNRLDPGVTRLMAGEAVRYGPAFYNNRAAVADPYQLGNEGGVHCG